MTGRNRLIGPTAVAPALSRRGARAASRGPYRPRRSLLVPKDRLRGAPRRGVSGRCSALSRAPRAHSPRVEAEVIRSWESGRLLWSGRCSRLWVPVFVAPGPLYVRARIADAGAARADGYRCSGREETPAFRRGPLRCLGSYESGQSAAVTSFAIHVATDRISTSRSFTDQVSSRSGSSSWVSIITFTPAGA